MKKTNININSPKGQMKYYVEYKSDTSISPENVGYLIDPSNKKVSFYGDNKEVSRNNNEWVEVTDDDRTTIINKTMSDTKNNYIPKSIHKIYRHIAWATDNKGSNMVLSYRKTTKRYIYMGVLVDDNSESSTNPEDYNWIYIAGVNNENIINGNTTGHIINLSETTSYKDEDYGICYLKEVLLDDTSWIKEDYFQAEDYISYINLACQLRCHFKNCKLAKTLKSDELQEIRICISINGNLSDGVEKTYELLSGTCKVTNQELNNEFTVQFQQDIDNIVENISFIEGGLKIEIYGLKGGQLIIDNFKIEENTIGCTPFTYSYDDVHVNNIYGVVNKYYHTAWMNNLYNMDNSFTLDNSGNNYNYIGVLEDTNITPSTDYQQYAWYYIGSEYEILGDSDISDLQYEMSSFNIYFPDFSVDTYVSPIKYVIDISTRINGVCVELCSKLLSRNNCLAVDNMKRFSNEEYFEYQNIDIIDPWYLIYGDSWKQFRQKVCGEKNISGTDKEQNNTGSLLNISIHPVKQTSTDNEGRKIYTEIDDYHGGQNSINMVDNGEDYLRFSIRENHKVVGETFSITPSLTYNGSYNKDLEGFQLYMEETYGIDDFKSKVECVLQDNDNIYGYTIIDMDDPFNTTWKPYDITDANDKHILSFNDWSDYKEGMYIHMILHICTEDTLDSSILYLDADRLLLTPELFRYLIKIDGLEDNNINIDEINMNIYNINAVNKIQQNIIQVERPDDYKANIIKPVFFRTQSLGNLIVHPDVTEQICINLDNYKSKVDSFIIKIEGISFTEYGRNNSGVIFKIVGSTLPGSTQSGTYYILNQDNEMITSGKYTYER